MKRWARLALVGVLLASASCTSGTEAPLSMRVVLNAAELPDGGKWNDLLGRPLVEVEYAAQPGTGTGGRTLFFMTGARASVGRSFTRRLGLPTPC
jgi:hypothetical protein